jgi:hypothetical protein
MYKTNGEEPMTKQEEMRRREAVAGRAIAERLSAGPKADSLRLAFYAALFGVSSSRETQAEAVFEQAQ